MCGIVGYIGDKEAQEVLLDGLTRLEYRGYDSAGIAVAAGGRTHLRRVEGKLQGLKELVQANGMPPAHLGIGHTRWATHGRPNETNAHPHHYQNITVVHNGIIENYLELRRELQARGHEFSSETDSEILAHLVVDALKSSGDTTQALREALAKVKGSYALALINHDEPDHLLAARFGSPLVLGVGKGEFLVASDVPALLPYTQQVYFLADGDVVSLQGNAVELTDLEGHRKDCTPKHVPWTLAMAEKEGYKHFMLKEIHEQPRALADTFRGRLLVASGEVDLPELSALLSEGDFLRRLQRIYLIACGTSWHAALVARYFLEPWSGVLVQVEQASEFRYREPVLDENTLVVAVSQSGETADTLVALKQAKERGARVLAVTNVVDSSLARESHAVLYTHAGPEIGVAATKTFVCQLAALQMVAMTFGQKTGRLEEGRLRELIQACLELPQKFEELLQQASYLQKLAVKYSDQDHCLFMGRGPLFPIALEGALKLKEISYLHAEGYSAGELKHGPIALIDQGTPLVALAPRDAYYAKMVSNIQEVLSRRASVIAVTTEGEGELATMVQDLVYIPHMDPALTPILAVVPLQLLAYYMADYKGHDVDQPRNLAKSVTVE